MVDFYFVVNAIKIAFYNCKIKSVLMFKSFYLDNYFYESKKEYIVRQNNDIFYGCKSDGFAQFSVIRIYGC